MATPFEVLNINIHAANDLRKMDNVFHLLELPIEIHSLIVGALW